MAKGRNPFELRKTDENIIEAGVTDAEFEGLFAGEISREDYLSEFPEQSYRYYHLSTIAAGRGDLELSLYFWELSGFPKSVDWCD